MSESAELLLLLLLPLTRRLYDKCCLPLCYTLILCAGLLQKWQLATSTNWYRVSATLNIFWKLYVLKSFRAIQSQHRKMVAVRRCIKTMYTVCKVTVGNLCDFCDWLLLVSAWQMSLLLRSSCCNNRVFFVVWRRNTTSMLTQVMNDSSHCVYTNVM